MYFFVTKLPMYMFIIYIQSYRLVYQAKNGTFNFRKLNVQC